ncbi:hypothetical protein [Nocardia sp. NPDC051750]|uniref:hypothetical protein n=1 Tax=Nocardia sp. NPDC051750 TaxID=3364325 RepID=UPI0037904638
MVTVTVTATGQDCRVAFSEYDPDLLEIFKSKVPRGSRKWDPDKREWRVSSNVTELCTELERGGAKVARTGKQHTTGTTESDTAASADPGSAGDWKRQYAALNIAAGHMQAEMVRLREEVEQLQKANQQLEAQLLGAEDPAPASGSWAEQLFHAVGRERRDKVHRALARIFHPDLQDGSKVLMQQLNDARDK